MSTVTEPVAVLALPAGQSGLVSPGLAGRSGFRRLIGQLCSVAIAAALVIGFVAVGRANGWKLPKAAALRGEAQTETDDWCKEHGVPDSECVECKPGLLPRSPGRLHSFGGRAREWCEEHGVHECPLCRPEVAQITPPPEVTEADRERTARALAFTQRAENDPKCQKHRRRVQLGSEELAVRFGLRFAPIAFGPVAETISAPGEVTYDPTRVARVSPRAAGTVWRVERQLGDKVRRGDVLALVDSAEVGRSKAEFLRSLIQLDLRREVID